ncbi:Ketosamine-3-kinase [Leucogyrophana mollusca]|uniref:Ketosamine-3-kinase n=1 Tax=Leucogyrophana mollusca TaxID=85980 RepID=A0ACB8C0B9_9AGAM|nr:Ketosamine-3-kinase [Leucogyrophana mollusca]
MPKTTIFESILLPRLRNIEPEAQFTLTLPIINSSSGRRYYGKVGTTAEKDQYIGEVESLKAIGSAAPGLAPRVLVHGVAGDPGEDASQDGLGRPYFISEYKGIASLTDEAGATLGKRMATELHAHRSPSGFGFPVPTFCGATRQENGWYETWEDCYSAMIGNLLASLKGKRMFTEMCNKGEEVRIRVIPYLLGSLSVEPVLLHGDLWSGNVGTDQVTGEPVIFDPSSYYGHNEADLAIARIFGGFPRSFFKTYHMHLPKTEPIEQYELRADLYELYHYLNHTVLFGSSYAGSALKKMDRLLRECP